VRDRRHPLTIERALAADASGGSFGVAARSQEVAKPVDVVGEGLSAHVNPRALRCLFLVVATLAYLALVEISKIAFYRFASRRQTDAAR
jgi:hypothetical protein